MFDSNLLFQQNKYVESINEAQISLTAYRAYFVLQLLLMEPHSKDEILEKLKQNKFLCKTGHTDSIVNSINTLRAVGCEIEKPKPSNNHKYTLKYHPFKINFTSQQVDILNFLRKSLYIQDDYKIILNLDKCYSLFIELSDKKSINHDFESSNYFKNINLEILFQLLDFCKEKAVINILYKSPICGDELLTVKCEKVFFENKRLYLLGWGGKYNDVSYYRIDKMIEINRYSGIFDKNICQVNVRYRLIGDSVKTFVPLIEEKIVSCSEEELIVEAPLMNVFNFYQRILGFASECEILSPLVLRESFREKIDEIIEASNYDEQ